MAMHVHTFSGGKLSIVLDPLSPITLHRFRHKVIIRPTFKQDYDDDNSSSDSAEETNEEPLNKDIDIKIVKSTEPLFCNRGNTNNRLTPIQTKGTIVQACNKQEESAKVIKTKRKKIKVPARIVSKWSDVLVTNTEDQGPSTISFFLAVQEGYTKRVLSMLEMRPELLEISNNFDSFTPLIVAIKKGELPMVQLLLNSGADVNTHSMSGQKTALMMAAYFQNLPFCRMLVQHGADIHLTDCNKMTPLHYAVDANILVIVKFLLLNGADVNCADNQGWTPLHRGVMQQCDEKIIHLLIENGGDLDAQDINGRMPKDYGKLMNVKIDLQKLLDRDYGRNKARSNYSRLTKKVPYLTLALSKR